MNNSRGRNAVVKTGAMLVIYALMLISVPMTAHANSTSHVLTPSTPFQQDWSNAGMITTNDVWDFVPSIVGFLGDTLPAGPGLDPQTILNTSITVDVIANRTNPNTENTGGVGEFDGLANPVVALQGSGTARAPYIDIYLNASGCAGPSASINVAYNVRDIDGSNDNAVQAVALQYRAGGLGNYVNVPAGFVADATTGPNQATLVTPVSAALPASASGQSLVQVRMITADAAGTDEWVGIDDINITCNVPLAAEANLRGRVSSSNGRGIGGVTVELSGGTISGSAFRTTNAFGYYTFTEVPVGYTYVVSVQSKRYAFDEQARVVTVEGNVSGIDFVTASQPVQSFRELKMFSPR